MKKNILIVDDSALMRRIICDIINSDTAFHAVDVCHDGQEAYEWLKKQKYDAVIMDINMPRMNGLEVLKKLQEERIPATVIVVSSLTTKDADTTNQALELGAVDFVTKPGNMLDAKSEDFKSQILSVLRAVLKVESRERAQAGRPMGTLPVRNHVAAAKSNGRKLIALACSTGGPKALQSVIPRLPENLSCPLVLVQHMPIGFTKPMADRLDQISKVHVKEAEDGEVLKDGWVYVAPGGHHMEIARSGDGNHKIRLSDRPPVGGLRPYANYMYESLSVSKYDEIVCVVLTGMGADGTDGIAKLSKHKPLHVICQDEKSCVVYGMPKAAVDAGLSDEVVPLQEVALAITKYAGVK